MTTASTTRTIEAPDLTYMIYGPDLVAPTPDQVARVIQAINDLTQGLQIVLDPPGRTPKSLSAGLAQLPNRDNDGRWVGIHARALDIFARELCEMYFEWAEEHCAQIFE